MTGIEKIEELLKTNIGEDKTIVDIKSENLVAPGENHGGELLKLEITSRDEKSGSEEKFHAVVKKIPANEMLQKLFNVQQTFRGEMNFYDKLVPALQDFQRRNGVQEVLNCFPKLFGARINLNGSDVVDRDAVIVLENLHISGFSNMDRHVGYDFESAELLLRDLAALHAVPLAMKLREPENFEKNVRSHCVNTMNLDRSDGSDPSEFVPLITQEILWESDKCSPFISKVKEVMKTEMRAHRTIKPDPREPFATFAHEDLWVNNVMIKMINGKPIENKFVDFQMYNYKSPASDLLFFLFTSVRQDVLQKDLDTLINFYHSEFIKNLNMLGCDTSPFVMSEFKKELVLESKAALTHIMIFLPWIVFGEKNQATPLPLNGKNRPDMTDPTIRDELRRNTNPKAKEKLWFTVQTFGRKGWL